MQAGPKDVLAPGGDLSDGREGDEVERAFSQLEQFVAEHGQGPVAREALEALRRAFRNANRDAQTDPLTGLPNRAWFQRALDDALTRCRRHGCVLALLFLDLDGFKDVNDRCGHEAGDLLLTAVARRVLSSVREGDLVARYGGDEFVVLLQGLESPEVAYGIAERVIEAVSTNYAVSGAAFQLTVSVGVALYPEHGCPAEELLRQADHAMYCAKRAGGRRYEVAPRVTESGVPPSPLPRAPLASVPRATSRHSSGS
jgi:diguanylate cyclase (GGDEF)-like protein